MSSTPKLLVYLKRDTIVVALACFVLVLFAFRFFGQTHLVPIGTTVDLGNVSVGQTAERKFSIVNSSSRAVEILRWTVSCQCMQAEFTQFIPPHAQVIALIRTTGASPLGSRAVVGTVQWRYQGEQFFRTDSFDARAKYVSALSFSEQSLDFGKVSFSGNAVKSIFVKAGNSGVQWNGLEVTADSQNLIARVLKDSTGYRIQFQLNPHSIPSGIWKNRVRIYPLLNGMRTGAEVEVPVIANVEGPFQVIPSVIQFPVDSDRPLYFSLKIHSTYGPIRKLNFMGALVQDPVISISAGGKDAVMTGILSVTSGKGAYVGKIPIQVNDDSSRILHVHYLGYEDDVSSVKNSRSETISDLGQSRIVSSGSMLQK